MSFLSVIIPTLNEAQNLPATLQCFRAAGIADVCIVDGGSTDGTVAGATASGFRVMIAAERGRAHQMNLGARASSGDVLLFMHGDTLVPERSLENLEAALAADPALIGGGFARRFATDSVFLRCTARWADFRGRCCGLFLGDQGIFVRRSYFEALGGFDEMLAPGEDLDFSFRMARAGKTCLIQPPVISSARRFEKRGALRQTGKDLLAARAILQYTRRKVAS